MIRTSLGALVAPAVVAAGLCGVLVWEFASFPSIDSSLAEPVSLQTARLPGAAQSGPQADSWARETLARPVFSPDRRPLDVPVRQAGGLRLTGIIVSELGKVAIFVTPAGGRATVIQEGGEINGLEILEVTQTGVVLAGPSGRTVMTPVFDPAPRQRAPLPVVVPGSLSVPVSATVAVKTESRP